MSESSVVRYRPDGEVLTEFLRDNSFVTGIQGPVGSGKSVGCCMKLFKHALEQQPDDDGIRWTRWGIIRNTYPMLKSTTAKTWLRWFKEDKFGPFNWSTPFTHHIRLDLADGTTVDAEFIFLALDRPDDVDKLLSFDFTGIWINEAREISKEIFDMATTRVSRFPETIKDADDNMLYGPSWYGVMADTNAPEEQHWWAIMSGQAPVPEWMGLEERELMQLPDNWSFYLQPPGMLEVKDPSTGAITGYVDNPNAENRKFLVNDYYQNNITNKRRNWIKVYVLNQLGSVKAGKPVQSGFDREVHVSKQHLEVDPTLPLRLGFDFGLTPACLIAQQDITGQWRILRELTSKDTGALRFGKRVARYLAKNFEHHWNGDSRIVGHGDPRGDDKSQSDETIPFRMLRKAGLPCVSAPTNDFGIRVEAFDDVLARLIDGRPGIIVDPSCLVFIAGLEGGYHYKKRPGQHDLYNDEPEKTDESHIVEAGQYLFLGGGEGARLMRMSKTERHGSVQHLQRDGGPFSRRRKHRAPARRGIRGH